MAEARHPEKPCCEKGRCGATGDRRQNEADPSHPEFIERRGGHERRENVVDRRLGLDRRRGPGRRRSEERKAAEEGQMSDEQFEFVMAIDEYKRANARPFPTWTEVLDLIKALGYRRVADPQPLAESHSASAGDKPAKGGRRSRKPQLTR
ncbi:hypothetical protein [Anaerobaca lacustris]|uniref:Uncharacterized protein n=1 Tax=Anaerobaca lacustris TaxID=3044600 RepID=A0AAW6TWR9_9BACT|nr:hypothetical protein [Sedimentisphaerales bacterium M17dextr]